MRNISSFCIILIAWALCGTGTVPAKANERMAAQLERWLQRFPEADADGDGILTEAEAQAYRKAATSAKLATGDPKALPEAQQLVINEGWNTGSFPDKAVYKRSPSEIMEIYKSGPAAPTDALSFPKPKDGAMRIVGVGHSFMAPAYKTLPLICRAAGFEQPMCLHTGGGVTGSARYKWEQENGIYQFDDKPVPKLLAAISNYDFEAMLWGAYYQDRPEFYTCWIEFCRKYHPNMKFYLANAWPQLYQLEELYGLTEIPESESFFTDEVLTSMRDQKREVYISLVETMRKKTTRNVFIIPTNDAVTEAAKLFVQGKLPGMEGLHRIVGGKERSIWRDNIGHLGPGMDRLEGYVFYATLYGKSPELITEPIAFADDPEFPSEELDRIFRKIAWQAVTRHPLSGVSDKNNNLIGDHLE